jgi:signal transduction histidine kinase
LKSKPTEKERESYLHLLEVSTNRLDETIRNLNEIIHISENTAKAKTSKQLKHEVEKTLDILNGVIAQNAIRVTVNIPEDLSVCIVDSYLDSILLNLLSNAVKYRSLDRPSEIHVFTEKNTGYVVLAIQDNGLGLNLDKYGEKIFGMYKTFHRNEDARGFGLFITKTQIESMGGRITVESREGEGSTFRVFFPLETQQDEVQNESIFISKSS